MTSVVIACAVLVLIGVPIAIVNRDIFRRAIRRRRHRRMAALPFLFFPTSERSETLRPPPPPAWTGQAVPAAERAMPLEPEPGIADLPLPPDPPEIADLRNDSVAARKWHGGQATRTPVDGTTVDASSVYPK